MNHILVLHGDFYERNWDREFDRFFSENLDNNQDFQSIISFQSVGLDRLSTPVSRSLYLDRIKEILDEQHIDMIVAVLPSAIEFILEVEGIYDIPKVLVLPTSSAGLESNSAGRIEVIESNSETAIRKTLEAALLLTPSARSVEFFSGAGQTDMEYLRKATTIAQAFSTNLTFNFNSGLELHVLREHLSRLNEDSIAVLLPYAAASDGNFLDVGRNLASVLVGSTVPLYSIVDRSLGRGSVGGYVYTVDQYAKSAAESVIGLIQGQPAQSQKVNVTGEFTFDYAEVTKTGLNLSRLKEPYVLVNQPRSIFNDYSGFITTIGILGTLLCIALAWQYKLLHRARATSLELQKSEQQAKENEALFQILTSNTLDVIWIWDSEKKQTTYCSPTIEQLTGFTSKEFLSLSIHEIMTASSATTALERAQSQETGAQVFEVELRRKDGELICCEIAAQPMDDTLGTNQWVGITRDVSQRKNAEKEQLALQNQLQQSQKFESLGTLAGGIAHDFNNILGTIMGLTELIKLRAQENTEATEIAEKLLATTDRAKALVGQILTFSRQSNSIKVAFDLNALLREAIQLMQTGMPKSISLSVDELDKPTLVLGDSNQLSQVFINVLTNAYEAVDEQTGEIQVSVFVSNLSEPTKFMHGELPAGSYLTVQITDNGGGVSEAELEKMFDPFYTSKDLGNGMGLAIARGIVISHGGAIDITSTPSNGCTVSISLPWVESDNVAVSPTLSQDNGSVEATILLVDDQKELLETISLMLQELGHKCICCSDPQQAMDCLANEELAIDLVITDYSMPGISGLELREYSAQRRPNTPVVIATGYSERVTQDDYLNKNPHLVLSKPFGFAEIKEMLIHTLKQPS
ncbi:MAG: ATP-binding protein [Pseudohongiellaceae bacterium]